MASLSEILAFSANFLTELLMAVKLLPRLNIIFQLSRNNWIPYTDEISKDWICIKLQDKFNIGK